MKLWRHYEVLRAEETSRNQKSGLLIIQTLWPVPKWNRLSGVMIPGTLHLTALKYIIIKTILLLAKKAFSFLALPQDSFPYQTPYFRGRNLQSAAHPAEMMKWSWSTMKVTFGRWTAFVFTTRVPVLASFDKTWNAAPARGFCDKRWSAASQQGSWRRLRASAWLFIVV